LTTHHSSHKMGSYELYLNPSPCKIKSQNQQSKRNENKNDEVITLQQIPLNSNSIKREQTGTHVKTC
jgi:hypothetical protein